MMEKCIELYFNCLHMIKYIQLSANICICKYYEVDVFKIFYFHK